MSVATSLQQDKAVSDEPMIGDVKASLHSLPNKKTDSETKEFKTNQDNSQDERMVETAKRNYTIKISPYRCALCKLRFTISNKMRRRAANCRGKTWRPEKGNYFH